MGFVNTISLRDIGKYRSFVVFDTEMTGLV